MVRVEGSEICVSENVVGQLGYKGKKDGFTIEGRQNQQGVYLG